MVQTRGSRRRIARVNVEKEHHTGVVATRGGRRKAKDAAFNPPIEVDDNQKSPDLRHGGERRQDSQKASTIAEDARKAATIADVMSSWQRILTCVVGLVIAGGLLNFAGMFLERLTPPPPPPPKPAHVVTKFLSRSYWALACCVAAVWRASTTRNKSLRSKPDVKCEVEKEKDREEEPRESRATEEAHQKLEGDWEEEETGRVRCQTAEEELNSALSRVPSIEPLLEKEAFMFDEVSGLTVPSSSLPVLSPLRNQNSMRLEDREKQKERDVHKRV